MLLVLSNQIYPNSIWPMNNGPNGGNLSRMSPHSLKDVRAGLETQSYKPMDMPLHRELIIVILRN